MSPDLAYIDSLWTLDSVRNPVTNLDDKKKQFAYAIWKEGFINLQRREDIKQSELKQRQSDIYQLIGFYSVFQGVWFQGVTQLAPQTSCRDSAIPVILSVLVSIATIVGVHLKLSDVFLLKKSFCKDKLTSAIQESRISNLVHAGLSFNLSTIGSDTKKEGQKTRFEEELEKLHRIRLALLVFLTILSALFAWLIGAIMCDKFP